MRIKCDTAIGCRLLGRVSDAGRLNDGAACSAAGVRKPPKEETALEERRMVPLCLSYVVSNAYTTLRR